MATQLMDFSATLLRKFPTDAAKGFYVVPHIPTGKLGRALNTYTRLAPKEVLAVHEYGGMFSTGTLAFTGSAVHHPKGYVPYEDIKGAAARENFVDLSVNQGGASTTVSLRTDSNEAARLLANVLDAIAFQPKAEDLVPTDRDYAAEGFDLTQVSWLQLRDEVLKTVDLLYQRFQDGKISLTEWEEKKAELLSRL